MRHRASGLTKRGRTWWIDKTINGRRVRESTGTGDFKEAERFLNHQLNEIRRVDVYRERPYRTFEQAAALYLDEIATRRSFTRDDQALRMTLPHLGSLELGDIHHGRLAEYAAARLQRGLSAGTVNRDMAVVRQVLKSAARRYHENGQPWLHAVPEIPRLKTSKADSRIRPITLTEQSRLMKELPAHLAAMTLFSIYTGARRGEVMELRWAWEVNGYPAFLIPAEFHKTGDTMGPRLLVCNSIAWRVVEDFRGRQAEFVFSDKGRPVRTYYGRAWRAARLRAALPEVRVHDLRHTFATRLEAVGVSRADVGELLGHAHAGVTRTYVVPTVTRLLQEVEKIVEMKQEPVLRLVSSSQNRHSPSEPVAVTR